MTWSEIVAVLGVAGTLCGIIFGYASFKRNRKADDEKEGKRDGVLLTEIGYIKSGVDDIKRKQERQEEKYDEVDHRLTVVEESTKAAHHRIDTISGI